jgi:hypothetical protein
MNQREKKAAAAKKKAQSRDEGARAALKRERRASTIKITELCKGLSAAVDSKKHGLVRRYLESMDIPELCDDLASRYSPDATSGSSNKIFKILKILEGEADHSDAILEKEVREDDLLL